MDANGSHWLAGKTYSASSARNCCESHSIRTGFLDFFQVPHASAAYCRAQLAQVDVNGNAWVAGSTGSSLDGNANKGLSDIFLMKFDAQGVHLWTRQSGGEGDDSANALQADWGATSLVFESVP